MRLIAEIGVILSILFKAIFKYALFPIIILTLLAFLFPKWFYVYPYVILARAVSITIVLFVLYVLIFGIYEMIVNKCIQRRIGDIRGYERQNALQFYPINIEKVIRIKRIGRIRKGVPGTFVESDFNLLTNMSLTVMVIMGIVGISFLLGR